MPIKSTRNQKEFINIVKSGFVGMFALTGGSIIFVIISQSSPRAVSIVEAIYNMVPSIAGWFAIVGGVGFVFGITLKRFFPKLQNGVLPLILSFLVLAIPLGFVGWVYYNAAHHMELPPSDAETNGVGKSPQ